MAETRLSAAEAWRTAGSLVLHKLVGELSYEGILRPTAGVGPDQWVLDLPDGVRYRFTARRGAFESWTVRPGSVVREAGAEQEPAWDPRVFVVDARATLSLSGLRLAEVLVELIATLTNECARLTDAPTIASLAALDYNRADGHLTGHQRLVLNKGRIGFSESDRGRYAPEAGQLLHVPWIAVHRGLASFRAVGGLTEEGLLHAELDASTHAEFQAILSAAGDPAEYVWLPVHPWQRDEVVGTLYAGELANGQVVDLGMSLDRYVPHQTVRTLANVDRPDRLDVKTALSVRNTSVYRGLGSAETLAGPAVTDWLTSIDAGDPLLNGELGLELLGEVASVSVRHPLLGPLPGLPFRFHETLGVLWREPIVARLGLDERAWSLAALPYRDAAGMTVIGELIRGSGLEPLTWLRSLLDAILLPLLHWLLRYGVAFGPHGQNVIVVVDSSGRPLRAAIKDFARGIHLLDEDLPEYATLADEVRTMVGGLCRPADALAQSLFSGLLNGELRFLAEILFDDFGVARTESWEVVRDVVRHYRAAHEESAHRFESFGLLHERVERGCRNAEHLSGTRFDQVDRHDELPWRRGTVANPLFGADPGGAW